jgi:signal transduction histidine kinase
MDHSPRGGPASNLSVVTQSTRGRAQQMTPPSVDARESDETALAIERRRRETFVSTLAHELRQPLSTMVTALDVVRAASGTAAATQAITILERQIDQMLRAVDDLLDATRWAQGKVRLRKQRLDLRDVVREAAIDVAATLNDRRQTLSVSTPDEPLLVNADPQRLHQVLSNLLRNAGKYTDPHGQIWLIASGGTAAVTLRVLDTGRGIAADALTSIFDLYSQVRPTHGTGVGIGLSVVRDIVRLHDGQIEARSPGLGQGSEFIVTLPTAI